MLIMKARAILFLLPATLALWAWPLVPFQLFVTTCFVARGHDCCRTAHPVPTNWNGAHHSDSAHQVGTALGIVLAQKASAQEDQAATNPYSGDPTAVEEGRRLYIKTGCYSCHELSGTGGGMVADLTKTTLSDGELFKTISKGRPGTLMVKWGGILTDDEIWKIVAYIRSIRSD